jgi:hypothetical protein
LEELKKGKSRITVEIEKVRGIRKMMRRREWKRRRGGKRNL